MQFEIVRYILNKGETRAMHGGVLLNILKILGQGKTDPLRQVAKNLPIDGKLVTDNAAIHQAQVFL